MFRHNQEASLLVTQEHRPTQELPTPPSDATGVTLGLPSTVTATTPQIDAVEREVAAPTAADRAPAAPTAADRAPAARPEPSRAAPAVPHPAAEAIAPARPAASPRLPAPPPGTNGGALTRRERVMALMLCAILGSVLGFAAQRLTSGSAGGPSAAAATATATPNASLTVVPSTVTSFDPSPGGSGFRQKAGAWATQTYYGAANFGNTKPGVGLVLDLGTAKALSAVRFTVGVGPITVELHAADAPPSSATSMPIVGQAVQAAGTTTLRATGAGAHRYWMIWVTKLAASSGGFSTTITDPTALA